MTRKKIRQVLSRKCWESTKVDCSSNDIGADEVAIVERLLRGDELSESRFYHAELDVYGWYWMWDYREPPERDGPIRRLWSRGIIRPAWCAGGYTWMKLTRAAQRAFGIED